MTDARRLRLLTFSTLFPNAVSPYHGVFVENRLRHLLASGEAESRVIAPVPWFPSANPRFGTYAAYAAAPRRERRHGIDIDHPRYPLIPRFGMTVAPALLYLWVMPAVRRLLRSGYDFDLIDAHYFYPDGVAAALIALSVILWSTRPIQSSRCGACSRSCGSCAIPSPAVHGIVRRIFRVSCPIPSRRRTRWRKPCTTRTPRRCVPS